jgi:hypothetical protein
MIGNLTFGWKFANGEKVISGHSNTADPERNWFVGIMLRVPEHFL